MVEFPLWRPSNSQRTSGTWVKLHFSSRFEIAEWFAIFRHTREYFVEVDRVYKSWTMSWRRKLCSKRCDKSESHSWGIAIWFQTGQLVGPNLPQWATTIEDDNQNCFHSHGNVRHHFFHIFSNLKVFIWGRGKPDSSTLNSSLYLYGVYSFYKISFFQQAETGIVARRSVCKIMRGFFFASKKLKCASNILRLLKI